MAREVTLFQGAGGATAQKSYDLGGLLKMRMRQNQGKWVDCGRVKRFMVFDLFCGDGYNIVNSEQILGSPLRVIEAIQNTKLASRVEDFHLVFSDVRDSAIDSLRVSINQEYLPSNVNTVLAEATAQEMLPKITESLKGQEDFHCVLILDPNGPAQLPLDELREFSAIHGKRSDVIINLNVTAYKRIWGHLSGQGKDSYDWWIAYIRDLDHFVQTVGEHYQGEWMRENRPGLGGWSILCCFGYSTPTFWAKAGYFPYREVRESWLPR